MEPRDLNEASLAALFQGSPAPVSVLFAGETVGKVGQIRPTGLSLLDMS